VRAGLIAAAESSPTPLDGYQKGSTVLCAHCFVPLFQLERGIGPGEKASRTVDAYRPITLAELRKLRREVTSIHAALKTWTDDQEREHVQRLPRPKTGDQAMCPACERSFVQVFAPDAEEVLDRAYTWRLVTVPPFSDAYPVRSSHVHR
jgi:hypothetical protein